MPPPLVLTEGDPAQRTALTVAEAHALNDLGIAIVTPTLEGGLFDVAAASKVGAVVVGDRQVVVRPKITDINRLIFMLGYARNPKIWRDDPVRVSADDELLPAVAEAFARIASRAVEQGLLQGYRTVTEALPVLRGRMLAGEQMSRRFGFPVPIDVEYDDFTVDIAENQLLAVATLRLLGVPRISTSARRQLQRLRHTLMVVSVPPRGAPMPRWSPSRLNARYQDALRLAEIVIAAESFEHRLGQLRVTGYMFDMWLIFEDFVTVAMSEFLTRFGWQCELQARLHLDDQRRVGMRPDLLCRAAGLPTAVVDAKYKAEKPNGFPNADLYQMLAYCTVLGLPEGHLIYAKGNEESGVHSVQRSGVTIHCKALDLGLEPAALLGQVGQLAGAVARAAVLHPSARDGVRNELSSAFRDGKG
jgi:5-methylcytosine-specific restriction enzyme subunit McrC